MNVVCFHRLSIGTLPTGFRLRFCLRTRVNLHALERFVHVANWQAVESTSLVCLPSWRVTSHNTPIRPRAAHAHILQLGDYLAKITSRQTFVKLTFVKKSTLPWLFFDGGEPVPRAGGPRRSPLAAQGTHRTYAATSLPPLTLNFKGLQQLFSPPVIHLQRRAQASLGTV